jgi:hypothetical protein
MTISAAKIEIINNNNAFLSQASWGGLEMKPAGAKEHGYKTNKGRWGGGGVGVGYN